VRPTSTIDLDDPDLVAVTPPTVPHEFPVTLDVTRKQIAGQRITWSARWQPRDAPAPVRGAIEATFDGDRVTALRLTAAR